jgi:hypothetical protein
LTFRGVWTRNDEEIEDEQINKDKFAPEVVRSFGKAPSQKDLNRGRKESMSTIYISKCEKEKIETECEEKQRKKVDRNTNLKAKNDNNMRRKNEQCNHEENKVYYCFVCHNSYA